MTLNVLVQVGIVTSAPERTAAGKPGGGQTRFTFACQSDSSFGMPAMREALLPVILDGRMADWGLHTLKPGMRLVVKGRLAMLASAEVLIAADWIEVVRR